MTEMPVPMTKVIANSIGVDGPSPRAAEPIAASTRPAISVRRAPIRAIRSEPGMATIANSRTGRPVSAATSFSLKSRSRWMSGSTGGSARIVRRRSMPASQRSARRSGGFNGRWKGCASFDARPNRPLARSVWMRWIFHMRTIPLIRASDRASRRRLRRLLRARGAPPW